MLLQFPDPLVQVLKRLGLRDVIQNKCPYGSSVISVEVQKVKVQYFLFLYYKISK